MRRSAGPSAVLGLTLLLAARAQAQPPPQLVVLDLSPEQLPEPYQQLKLGQEIGRAVEAGGCLVTRTCTSEECARNDPRPGTHLLTFEVRYDRKQFACSLSLELRDHPGGRIEYREKSGSPVCPAAQALEDIKRAARMACEELGKAPVSAPLTTKAGHAAPTVRSAGPAPAPAEPSIGRGLSTGLVIGGAAALAGGAALLFLNGQPTSCASSPGGDRVCTRTRQTVLPALPLLVLGAAATGWGGWRLLSPAGEAATSVGVGPGGLTVRGRF